MRRKGFEVVRFIAGIVLLCLGTIFLLILLAARSPAGEIMVPIAMFGLPGGLLLYFGRRYLTRRKAIINTAFLMLRESRSINVAELAARVGLSEDSVAEILAEARHKGLIPESNHGRLRD